MSTKSLLRSIRSRIADMGGQVVGERYAGHVRITARFPQGDVTVTCACSPSDETAAVNTTIQAVRRRLRESAGRATTAKGF